MSIGQEQHLLCKNTYTSFVKRILGTSDVHSHFRTRPLQKIISTIKKPILKVLEPGCGSGVNIFLIDRIINNKKTTFTGFDLNPEAISFANKIKTKLQKDNLQFLCKNIDNHTLDERFDLIILMDVLEHINNPNEFLMKLQKKLCKDGLLLISVPTPNYPKIFGRRFHKEVGHLIDGYTLTQMHHMLKNSGFRIVTHKYNTGLLANCLCFLYYRFIVRLPFAAVRSGLGWLFSLTRWCDVINHPRISSSLFIVAESVD